MARAPLWLRRLFRQRIDSADRTTGADLGFTGLAAKLVITDDHRAAAIQNADTAEGRMCEAYGYLRKVLKHGGTIAGDFGDQSLIDQLDGAREALAEHAVMLAEQLKAEMAARGYGDSMDEPAEPSEPLSILSAFPPLGRD